MARGVPKIAANVRNEGKKVGRAAPALLRRSCDRCWEKKRRCPGGDPCSRCVRASFVCTRTPRGKNLGRSFKRPNNDAASQQRQGSPSGTPTDQAGSRRSGSRRRGRATITRPGNVVAAVSSAAGKWSYPQGTRDALLFASAPLLQPDSWACRRAGTCRASSSTALQREQNLGCGACVRAGALCFFSRFNWGGTQIYGTAHIHTVSRGRRNPGRLPIENVPRGSKPWNGPGKNLHRIETMARHTTNRKSEGS